MLLVGGVMVAAALRRRRNRCCGSASRTIPTVSIPARAYSFVGRIILASLCNKLVDTAPDLHFVPQLALAWDTAPDGRAVTFRLRPGVKFSDGTDLDAAAVAFNLDRAMHLPASRRRSEIAAIDTIEHDRSAHREAQPEDAVRAADRAALRPRRHDRLAEGAEKSGRIRCRACLLRPVQIRAAGGAGPASCSTRDPLSWDRDHYHIDRVEFHVVVDPTVRLADLRAGSLDFAERILASDVAGLKADHRFKVLVGPSLQYNGITFNLANGTGGNPDFQQHRRSCARRSMTRSTAMRSTRCCSTAMR